MPGPGAIAPGGFGRGRGRLPRGEEGETAEWGEAEGRGRLSRGEFGRPEARSKSTYCEYVYYEMLNDMYMIRISGGSQRRGRSLIWVLLQHTLE